MFEEDRLFWSSSRPYLASDNLGKVGNCAVARRERFKTARSRCPPEGHPSKALRRKKQLWSNWKNILWREIQLNNKEYGREGERGMKHDILESLSVGPNRRPSCTLAGQAHLQFPHPNTHTILSALRWCWRPGKRNGVAFTDYCCSFSISPLLKPPLLTPQSLEKMPASLVVMSTHSCRGRGLKKGGS